MEEPSELMDIRSRKREGVVVRTPDMMSVQIKKFNEHLYMSLSIEIADWMSSLLKTTINPDLCTSLADGIALCRLLDEFIPGGKLGKYNQNADKFPAFAHDNIHIFSTKCKELGIRGNYVLNPSHFEKKQIKEIVNCILLLAFFGKQKKMEEALPALEKSEYREMLPTSSAFETDISDSSDSSDSSDEEVKPEKEVSDWQMWISLGVVAITILMALYNYSYVS